MFVKSSFSIREVSSPECCIFYIIRKTEAKVVENSALCFSQLPLTVWEKQLTTQLSSRGSWLQMDGIITGVFSLKAKRTGSLSHHHPEALLPLKKENPRPQASQLSIVWTCQTDKKETLWPQWGQKRRMNPRKSLEQIINSLYLGGVSVCVFWGGVMSTSQTCFLCWADICFN